METERKSSDLLAATAVIAAQYLSNSATPVDQVAAVIRSIHAGLAGLDVSTPPPPVLKPFVPIKQSVSREYIICLEDGKKLKMLKRYLRSHFNLSPQEYRARWGLPADYPLTAPAYASRRSQIALASGLGKRPPKRAAKRKAG